MSISDVLIAVSIPMIKSRTAAVLALLVLTTCAWAHFSGTLTSPSATLKQRDAVRTSASELPGQSERNSIDSRGMSWNPRDSAAGSLTVSEPRIIVRKAQRKLFLYSGHKLVRTYRIGLGLSPVGDKVREGDRRTPEGDFYIFTKNDKSAFYLSLGISYPNATHAKRGLRDGLITKTQYDAIIDALDS